MNQTHVHKLFGIVYKQMKQLAQEKHFSALPSTHGIKKQAFLWKPHILCKHLGSRIVHIILSGTPNAISLLQFLLETNRSTVYSRNACLPDVKSISHASQNSPPLQLQKKSAQKQPPHHHYHHLIDWMLCSTNRPKISYEAKILTTSWDFHIHINSNPISFQVHSHEFHPENPKV